MNDLTAAHRTLPMPSLVRVTNLENGRSLQLKVNDRGPFYNDRIIDVSRRAAQMLGFYGAGTAPVEVEILAEESRQMAAALGVPVDAPAARPVQTAALTPPQPAEVPAAAPVPEPLPVATEPAGWSPHPEPLPAALDRPLADAALPDATYEAPAVAELPPALPDSSGPSIDAAGLYVQAGAFADPGRAYRVRQRLAVIGPVVLSPSRVNGRELLRVRVGPLASGAEADRVLASVSQAGFPDSRLIAE